MIFDHMFKGISSDEGKVLDTDVREDLRQEWRCLHVDSVVAASFLLQTHQNWNHLPFNFLLGNWGGVARARGNSAGQA